MTQCMSVSGMKTIYTMQQIFQREMLKNSNSEFHQLSKAIGTLENETLLLNNELQKTKENCENLKLEISKK